MLVFNSNSISIRQRYRSKVGIVAEILVVTRDKPLTITHVMYGAFLSTQTTKGYLEELVSKGLLIFNKNDRTFKTSVQGIEFLKFYESMKKLSEGI